MIIFLVCVAFLEHKTYSKEAYDKESLKVIQNSELTHEQFSIMFTCITLLMEVFLRNKNISSSDLSEALKELKFSDECIEDIVKVLIANQQTLTTQFQEMKLLKPIDDLQTRINISLVETGQPTVILHMQHKGRIQTINLSLKHFHRFRLTIATILGEMYALEGKKS